MRAQLRTWWQALNGDSLDWRIRWPLILLPLLLFALCVMLVRLSQQQGAGLGRVESLHTEWQSVQQILTEHQASEAAPPPEIAASGDVHPGVMSLVDMSLTLQSWLERGPNQEEVALRASALSALAERMLAGGVTDPVVQFWRPFSAALADLEDAAAAGRINTPESLGLLQELRREYAHLRQDSESNRGSIAPVPSNPTTPALADIRADNDRKALQQLSALDQNGIEAMFSSLAESRNEYRRLAAWTIMLSVVSLLTTAVLLWGLWRYQQKRSLSDEGKVRREQAAILKLLDEMAPLAQGDLRVQATVSEAMTGALADAFNYAVSELRWLVGAVSQSADRVRVAVVDTRKSAQELAQASSVQAREIHRSSNYLNVMSDTMSQLSAHAAESSRIADTSVEQARNASLAVRANVKGLLRIHEQADMTTRLMQRLMESTDAIQDRADDISGLARRTDLLALNATIRAAAGSEHNATDDLSTLADDISQLAKLLNSATRDIKNVTDVIRQDATLTLDSMSRTSTELSISHQQAEQASTALEAIAGVSQELQLLINDVASKTLRQAGVIKQLSANMAVINEITRDSSMGMQSSARSLEELHEMASELRSGVSGFRLPDPRPQPGQAARQLQSVALADGTQDRATTQRGARASRVDRSRRAGDTQSAPEAQTKVEKHV